MSNNKLETERQRGEKAKLLLEEPLFKEAFDLLKEEYQSAMFKLNTMMMMCVKPCGKHIT